jgi:hypothetical protein
MTTCYFTIVQNVKPVWGIVSILRQSSFILCKLTRNADFHSQTGFIFRTAVRLLVVTGPDPRGEGEGGHGPGPPTRRGPHQRPPEGRFPVAALKQSWGKREVGYRGPPPKAWPRAPHQLDPALESRMTKKISL